MIDHHLALLLLTLLTVVWPAVAIYERRAIIRHYTGDGRAAHVPGDGTAHPPQGSGTEETPS